MQNALLYVFYACICVPGVPGNSPRVRKHNPLYGGATAIWPTPPIRRRQPRPLPFESAGDAVSTYARPVGGAVLTESALAKTELKNVKLSKIRHG